MTIIDNAKTVRRLHEQAGRTIYLAVSGNCDASPTGEYEDIIRIRWRRPDSWLPHTGNGFLAAGRYNNYRETVPLNQPDDIQNALDIYREEGLHVTYDPSAQEMLQKTFETRMRAEYDTI